MQLPCNKKNLRELISGIGQISFCVLGEEILTNFYATGKKVKIGKILLGQNAFVLDPLDTVRATTGEFTVRAVHR